MLKCRLEYDKCQTNCLNFVLAVIKAGYFGIAKSLCCIKLAE